MTKIPSEPIGEIGIDLKNALEEVYMTDLDKWKQNKQTENMTIKRRRKLAG
ncbi:MAG: hypothetical protein ACK5L5_07440 [Bacteroidales bacterium]